ncbi:translocation/assembly module TamB domain-containing protein [Terricaulis sp.]|uniref:translocation/assembly module TamB domain-containing protein n=1 Tax=Terricaulis sp. TaxID=2768686 RepID=UPI003784E61B
MSEPEAPAGEEQNQKRKRRWRKRTVAAFAAGVATAGGLVATIGPLAPWVVDNFADNQRVWRLGQIRVDGVSGGWLGALQADHISIEDKDGVWFEAENVDLTWRPQDAIFGRFWLDAAHARLVTVHRQPSLAESRPSTGATPDLHIGELRIDRLIVGQQVVEQAAEFQASLQLDLKNEELRTLDLNLRRTDSDADHVRAIYRSGVDYDLNIDASSARGGVLARLLGVSEEGVRFTAAGDGDATTGGARFQGAVGEVELLAATAQWTAQTWSTEGRLRMDLLPGLALVTRRIGPTLAFNGEGARVGEFRAHFETPFLAVDTTGALSEARELEGPAHFVAVSNRVSDIARESPFDLGRARLEGDLRIANGTTAIQAVLDAQDMDILGRRAHFTGPVRAALTPQRFTLTGDLAAAPDAAALFAQGRIRTELAYDRRRARFTLDHASIDGAALSGDAHGWYNDGDGEFAGAWRIKTLATLAGGVTGAASGRYRAYAAPVEGQTARVWTTSVDGAGANIGGTPEVVPQLLGRASQLEGLFTYENGGITVSHLRVMGQQLRAAANGRIVRGDANLALEASARGPLSIGDAQIAGAVDLTGRITGRIARPTLRASAQLSSFTAGGVVVAQPQVDFSIAPVGAGYRGHADVLGTVSEKPMTASADIGIQGASLTMTSLVAQVAALEAQGSASITPRGASANLDVHGALDGLIEGLTGRVLGHVQLTPQTLVADVQLSDARAGELRIRAATISAAGPLDAIPARFDLRGRLRQAPLDFAGTATIDATGDDANARIEGAGELAGAAIATRSPIIARWNRGGLDAQVDVTVADGALRANWQERGRALSGSAEIENAPLAPLAAIWGERATGRIGGRFNLSNAAGGLDGAADITFTDARFAGRQRGTLNAHIIADLDPSRLTANIDATSSDGLVAHFEADAPVTTSAAPIRIALARERRGRATWSLHGPAETLWAAARLQDQSLQGNLEGDGTLEFGAGYLSGSGQIEIADGRFEDKLSGVTLVDLDALVSISERGVNIERFSAAGPRGGRLTATGGSANDREGRIAVTLNDMRIADRPDARATASGELTLAWQGLQSSLTGQLHISDAEVDVAAHAEAGIPTIEVVEINRPGEEDEPEDERAPSPRYAATTLDVRIDAPGRVFTRGRGLEAEWALDLRLAGTAAEPRLFGQARSIRGQLAISGQPFELEESRIFFNGDPLDARIDLSATRDTADLSARIRLTGTARDPDITFSSDPALPEDEILPQILFGHSVEDLNGFEAAQLAASLATLSGRASFDLVDAARAAAGLDRFNVRQDAAGGFLVAGGVYLTRQVYVEVARTGLGQAQTSVEWTIRPRLVMITSFLANGDQRVSLRWRRESD